jgi:hypothetical protein
MSLASCKPKSEETALPLCALSNLPAPRQGRERSELALKSSVCCARIGQFATTTAAHPTQQRLRVNGSPSTDAFAPCLRSESLVWRYLGLPLAQYWGLELLEVGGCAGLSERL